MTSSADDEQHQMESERPAARMAGLNGAVPVKGQYVMTNIHGLVATLNLATGRDTAVSLPPDPGATAQTFAITRSP